MADLANKSRLVGTLRTNTVVDVTPVEMNMAEDGKSVDFTVGEQSASVPTVLGLSDLENKSIFVCEYGTTTLEEMQAALAAGKHLVCKAIKPDDNPAVNYCYAPLFSTGASGTRFYFTRFFASAAYVFYYSSKWEYAIYKNSAKANDNGGVDITIANKAFTLALESEVPLIVPSEDGKSVDLIAGGEAQSIPTMSELSDYQKARFETVITQNDDESYSTSHTFAEMKAAKEEGRELYLVDNTGGPEDGFVYPYAYYTTEDEYECYSFQYAVDTIFVGFNIWSSGAINHYYYSAIGLDETLAMLDEKQDKLIAGDNITIAEDGKTISATGGSGESNVFIAKYDVWDTGEITNSTYDEVKAAFDAGKALFVFDGYAYLPMSSVGDADEFYFSGVYGDTDDAGKNAYLYSYCLSTDGSWSKAIAVGDDANRLAFKSDIPDATTVEQVQTSGTEIAKVNGTSIYVPEGGGSSTVDNFELNTYTEFLGSASYDLADNDNTSTKNVTLSFDASGCDRLVLLFNAKLNSTSAFYIGFGTTAAASGVNVFSKIPNTSNPYLGGFVFADMVDINGTKYVKQQALVNYGSKAVSLETGATQNSLSYSSIPWIVGGNYWYGNNKWFRDAVFGASAQASLGSTSAIIDTLEVSVYGRKKS